MWLIIPSTRKSWRYHRRHHGDMRFLARDETAYIYESKCARNTSISSSDASNQSFTSKLLPFSILLTFVQYFYLLKDIFLNFFDCIVFCILSFYSQNEVFLSCARCASLDPRSCFEMRVPVSQVSWRGPGRKSHTHAHKSPASIMSILPSKLAHQDLTYCLEVHMSKRERNQMRQAMWQKADSQG